MDEFINEDSVIKNEYYSSFQDSVTCPLCLSIFIDPVMCMKCQNVYCRKCADDWSKKDSKCPNRCLEPKYQKCLQKDEILSNLHFKCEKCKLTISYNKAKNHKDNCCYEFLESYEIFDHSETPKFDIIKNISKEEVAELNKSGNQINHIKSNCNI